MRRRSILALLVCLSAVHGCGGGSCELEGDAIPIGYCGYIECNVCDCRDDGPDPYINCTIAGCLAPPDRCWPTGGLQQHICSRDPVFQPCDYELSPEEECHVRHGRCDTLPSGECGFVDTDGSLDACLAAL